MGDERKSRKSPKQSRSRRILQVTKLGSKGTPKRSKSQRLPAKVISKRLSLTSSNSKKKKKGWNRRGSASDASASADEVFTPIQHQPWSPREEQLHQSLLVCFSELGATREELATQKAHFQQRLDAQAEQIQLMQKTIQALATKLSLDV